MSLVHKTEKLILILIILSGINILYLCLFNYYDFYLGPINLTAHGLFKPLIWLNEFFFLFILFFNGKVNTFSPERKNDYNWNRKYFISLVFLIVTGLYFQSLFINYVGYGDWDFRYKSASLPSLKGLLTLFKTPQPDGFYRPLTFTSLWLDYKIFADHIWGYHIQNVLIHFLNCVIIYKIGLGLKFEGQTSRWAALIYAVAAINFEAVVWPGARFDLLATLFTLLAINYFIKYINGQHDTNFSLYLFVLSFILGLLSKESAYCFPLIVILILLFHKSLSISTPSRKKYIYSICSLLIASLMMIGIRLIIYGSLGGYRDSNGGSAHFHLGPKTLLKLLINSTALPLFGLNTTIELPVYTKLALVAFIAVLFISVFQRAKYDRKKIYIIFAALLLSALPAGNLLGWIRPSMLHCRYLYLPAVWMTFIIASVIKGQKRFSSILLILFVIANAIGTCHNLQVYKDMLEKTEAVANLIYRDYTKEEHIRNIYILGLPEAPNGVLFFPAELASRIKNKLPSVSLNILSPEQDLKFKDATSLIYYWSSTERTLILKSHSELQVTEQTER